MYFVNSILISLPGTYKQSCETHKNPTLANILWDDIIIFFLGKTDITLKQLDFGPIFKIHCRVGKPNITHFSFQIKHIISAV
jgi:hypothetical protein